MPPKITVLTTSYNAENTIRASIESVLNQTFTNFEYIIVDDASSDSTPAILKEYASKDSRIKLFFNDVNQERCFSRNRGIQKSEAPFIAMLDNDDVFLPEKLEIQYTFMLNNPHIAVCGTGARYLNWMDYIPQQENQMIRLLSLFECPLIHSTLLINKDTINQYLKSNWYNSEYVLAEDYEFLLQLIKHENIQFHNVQEILCICDKTIWIENTEKSLFYKEKQNKMAHKARKIILQDFNIPLDIHSTQYHAMLYGESYPKTNGDVQSTLKWAEQLIANSSNIPYFSTALLQEFIGMLRVNFTNKQVHLGEQDKERF